ncbi:MAG: gliding motility-associated ABC transporter substrate-binding protein GldG [Bacteroidetes bacterium]|jgi:ABC-2 type transport system permease protein|nr:gliding motility-associated ABC transporter substrate-binding protein GldG [Bacteroidota bacterium]MBT6687011.1 gliding motility-associated ABC transporter substrate-binding protein GldG [Bacteroidota bacterium]MBT7144987.1 gliding motility-associated ABC transporter substrate-binding protein GldG [Bacteroidota bacterium]
MKKIMKINNKKKQNILQLFLLLTIIVLLNYVVSFVFLRIDLTSEKRFTLSAETKDLLQNLDDIFYIKIYLDGELPSGFKRLRQSTKQILNEFRVYGKDNIQYEFINPLESQDLITRNEIGKELYDLGLMPITIYDTDDEGGQTQKIVFPGAIVSYRNRELPLELLKNNLDASPEQNLNLSIQGLEYEFVNTFKKLSVKTKQNVAFIYGHGELDENEVADISESLKEYYNVSRIKIDEKLSSLEEQSLIIIAKPDSAFSEKDKFVIDQFVMYGGKVLWLVDGTNADMDQLQTKSDFLAVANDLNLDDQLFTYGVRINQNLVLDMRCGGLKINTSVVGAEPVFRLFPWYYFPVIVPSDKHIVSKNLNLVRTEFVSNIDTVGKNTGIKKTALLQTSEFSRIVRAPARIRLDLINEKQDERQYNKKNMLTAVLLEGNFKSVFRNRLTNEITDSKDIDYKDLSEPTKMIVISDGDIIKNQLRKSGDKIVPFPLGFDRHSDMNFGNSEFILNAINYLCEYSGVISLRSREIKLRLLDRPRVKQQKLMWQIINTLLPILFIIVFGLLANYFRKRKYSTKVES